jgi:hypothetical protein
MAKKDDKKETMVAEIEITSALGTERIRSFDAAWTRMGEIGYETLPVRCKLVGFVRKDS